MKKRKIRQFSPIWWAGMMAAAAASAVGISLVIVELLMVWEMFFL